MKIEPPPPEAPVGVVPRVQLTGAFHPLVSQAQVEGSRHPFYAKLRVAAQNELLTTGKGQLYLGYFLDPIYDVHWNNEAAAVSYEMAAPHGVSVSPAKGQGPVVNVPADADPREFLVDVNRGTSTEPLRITLHYYGCTNRWCIPISQEYLISWQMDRDSGTQFVGREIDPRMLEQYPK